MAIQLGRGTNVSHWLSQSERRGAERQAWFTRDDVRRIADWGLDHFRLPVDEVQMWDEQERPLGDGFDLMDQALDWAAEAGLNVVLDLHILRSHFFNQATEPPLFSDPLQGQKFARLWQQLSARLSCRDNQCVAYELMNEPVAHDNHAWNRVARIAFDAIRKLEPQREIILGSNRWCSVLTFDELAVPDDEHTILTFHFYHPMLITHHRAQWCAEGKMYDGPVQYPGRPIPDDQISRVVMPPPTRLITLNLDELNKPYRRSTMVADLAKPLAVAKRTGRPLYCGEFGVINLAPESVRHAWFRDIVSVFEEYGIGWANWDYRGDFGLLGKDGKSTGLAEAAMSVDAAILDRGVTRPKITVDVPAGRHRQGAVRSPSTLL
ncbi:cellulase family glycosylhydrolase [soil metagenome]